MIIMQATIPVNVKWRQRTKAKVFVHNGGHGGLGGRNGTKQVIEAMKHVKSPIRLILRSQDDIYAPHDERISVEIGTVPSSKLYDGDVFLFPEKFNGLSLPLQEAFASGMAVMAGDRFPMNEWLPKDILIPVNRYTKERISCEFDCAHYDPKSIAMKIDEWYNKPIESLSLIGKEWAEKNSWDKLKQHYLDLCATNR